MVSINGARLYHQAQNEFAFSKDKDQLTDAIYHRIIWGYAHTQGMDEKPFSYFVKHLLVELMKLDEWYTFGK